MGTGFGATDPQMGFQPSGFRSGPLRPSVSSTTRGINPALVWLRGLGRFLCGAGIFLLGARILKHLKVPGGGGTRGCGRWGFQGSLKPLFLCSPEAGCLCSHRPADPAVLAWPRPGQHRPLVVTLASPGCGFVLGNRLGRLPGQESEQAPGVGDGQGSLACCSPGGRKELNATERLN